MFHQYCLLHKYHLLLEENIGVIGGIAVNLGVCIVANTNSRSNQLFLGLSHRQIDFRYSLPTLKAWESSIPAPRL